MDESRTQDRGYVNTGLDTSIRGLPSTVGRNTSAEEPWRNVKLKLRESNPYPESIGLPRPNMLWNAESRVRSYLPAHPNVTVVIPTKNEAANIGWVMRRIPSFVSEVVLVDADSSDGTVEVARRVRQDVRVVIERALGKGVALRRGFAEATGDIIVMLDADGSMDPRELPRFVEYIVGGFEFVKGSRYMIGGGSEDITFVRNVGNRSLNAAVNLLYHSRFSDLCYGYSAFRRSCLDALELQAVGFEIETEMVVNALRAGLRITEVPSLELRRRYGESNLHAFRDGRRVLSELVNSKLKPLPEDTESKLRPRRESVWIGDPAANLGAVA